MPLSDNVEERDVDIPLGVVCCKQGFDRRHVEPLMKLSKYRLRLKANVDVGVAFLSIRSYDSDAGIFDTIGIKDGDLLAQKGKPAASDNSAGVIVLVSCATAE